MDYNFTLRAVYPYLGELWDAMQVTLMLSLLAIAISLTIGAAVAVMRRSHHATMRFFGSTYVEVMRNTPLLVILYITYFALPTIGIRFSSFDAALIALSLNSAGYMAEILRAGFIAVPKGQYEACYSQGMTGWQSFRHVVFPQVIRTVYAPLSNQFISVVLASSLASAIAVEDVTSWMQTAGASSFRFFETFLISAAVYVVLCQSINLIRLAIGYSLFKNKAGAR